VRSSSIMFYVSICIYYLFFFFSSRRRHTRFKCDWSSDVCSSDLMTTAVPKLVHGLTRGLFRADIDKHWASFQAYDVKQAAVRRRSEERRVGKECRWRRGGGQWKKKEDGSGLRGGRRRRE